MRSLTPLLTLLSTFLPSTLSQSPPSPLLLHPLPLRRQSPRHPHPLAQLLHHGRHLRPRQRHHPGHPHLRLRHHQRHPRRLRLHNRSQLHDTISLGPYGGNGVTDVTYDAVVFTWHSCDDRIRAVMAADHHGSDRVREQMGLAGGGGATVEFVGVWICRRWICGGGGGGGGGGRGRRRRRRRRS